MLVIRRLDQWAGKAVRYKLLLDGQASAKIKNGEKLEIRPSTMGSHEIAVSYEILGILLFESEAIRFNYDGSNIDFECGTSGDQPYLKLLGSEDAEVPLVTPESEKKLQPADYKSSERKGVMQKLTIKGVFTVAVTGCVFLLLAFRLFGGEQAAVDAQATVEAQTAIIKAPVKTIESLIAEGTLSEWQIQGVRLGSLDAQSYACTPKTRLSDTKKKITTKCDSKSINGGKIWSTISNDATEVVYIGYKKSYESSVEALKKALIVEYGMPILEGQRYPDDYNIHRLLYWGNAVKDGGAEHWIGTELSAEISSCRRPDGERCKGKEIHWLTLTLTDFSRMAEVNRESRVLYDREKAVIPQL